jgi:RNA polymerase sigma factor (sigma-70 family)
MSQQNDLDVINKVIDGNVLAFESLVDKYKNMVYTIAYRITNNNEEAEEVAQDTFVKAYHALAKFNGTSKFSSWIYRIAYNTGLDRIKKTKKDRLNTSLDGIDQSNVAESNFESGLEQKELQKSVKECIQSLPESESIILTLFYYDDLKVEEIAKVVKLSVSNVKVKLFRARKKLHDIIKKNVDPNLIESYEQYR